MKLKLVLSFTAIIGLGIHAQAQYAGDALRFAQTQPGSSARFKAIGNAHTAIGGDLSSLGGNPAGLGLFTRSELSSTLEFNNYNSQATFLNKNSIGNQDRLNVNQAGAVIHIPAYRPKGFDLKSGWISFDFGIGYNRNADYGNNLVFTGTNPNNSISDYFAELATKNYDNPSSLAAGSIERMAYDDYLIGYDALGDYYFPETDINSVQTKSEKRLGGQSQLNMAIAANYSNKFYVGLNLGFVSLKYMSESQFSESGYNVTENSDYETSYVQQQDTRGKGFNAKLGFIYKPNQVIRLGASFETPTWYRIDDSYTEVLNTTHEAAGLENVNTPENYMFTYRLRTPMKLSAGLGVFLGQYGFISADVDMVDYANMNFAGLLPSDLNVINENNEAVQNLYKKAYNYRLGAEFKFDKLMLRGGYGIQGNPYRDLADADNKTQIYSAGLGYRVRNYYLDLSYQQVNFNTEMKPYILDNGSEPQAIINTKRNNVFVTVGMRF